MSKSGILVNVEIKAVAEMDVLLLGCLKLL
jgi:hypothetical protein